VVGKSLNAVLSTLASDKRFNVLSTPRICTTNNRQAQINISQSVPYVQDVRETESGTRTYSIGYLDVGIILDVTPRITRDGLVTIEVVQQANELQGFTTFQAPMVSQRQAETTITVRDGETIILGGMIRDQKDRTVRKVPVLGDLPLIGGLFRSMSNSTQKTELMVFLTPRVVRDPEQAAQLTELQKKQINVVLPPPPGSLPETPESQRPGAAPTGEQQPAPNGQPAPPDGERRNEP
jgi:general secretion pathway protein D